MLSVKEHIDEAFIDIKELFDMLYLYKSTIESLSTSYDVNKIHNQLMNYMENTQHILDKCASIFYEVFLQKQYDRSPGLADELNTLATKTLRNAEMDDKIKTVICGDLNTFFTTVFDIGIIKAFRNLKYYNNSKHNNIKCALKFHECTDGFIKEVRIAVFGFTSSKSKTSVDLIDVEKQIVYDLMKVLNDITTQLKTIINATYQKVSYYDSIFPKEDYKYNGFESKKLVIPSRATFICKDKQVELNLTYNVENGNYHFKADTSEFVYSINGHFSHDNITEIVRYITNKDKTIKINENTFKYEYKYYPTDNHHLTSILSIYNNQPLDKQFYIDLLSINKSDYLIHLICNEFNKTKNYALVPYISEMMIENSSTCNGVIKNLLIPAYVKTNNSTLLSAIAKYELQSTIVDIKNDKDVILLIQLKNHNKYQLFKDKNGYNAKHIEDGHIHYLHLSADKKTNQEVVDLFDIV